MLVSAQLYTILIKVRADCIGLYSNRKWSHKSTDSLIKVDIMFGFRRLFVIEN